ncbi:MAG: ABC-type transport system involved in resistance to organic solvent, periplasmic component [Acidobacteria bacterium]|nr:ABC-type transport system involved in resistance to organic solvent, periplasmic component [Acidobacteriota bacterium]
MERKRQVTLAEIKLGIVVTVALLLLAALILQQSWGVAWFARTVKVVSYLPDVGGLKPGAPVWLAGIEVGKVRNVTIVPPEVYAGNEPLLRQLTELHQQLDTMDMKAPKAKETAADLMDRMRTLESAIRFVQVTLEIRPQFMSRISKDSEVSIGSRGLIGDSFIQISPGSSGVPPSKKDDYYVLEGVRTAGFREIITGANDVMANFGVLSDQVKDIALKLNSEKIAGGVTSTMKELQDTVGEARRTFARASALMEDMRQGQGSFGRFVADPTLYRRLTEALEKFNKTLEQMQSGNGTLARLINDPAVYDNARDMLHKADVMMDRIEKGEGTFGKLSKDEALYQETKDVMTKFGSLLDQIDKGEGTMGRLLKDPSLYNNLNQSTAEITKLIYDLRQDPKKYLTIRMKLF